MAYLLLVLAIATEVLGTSLLKSTDGFSRAWPTVACLVSYAVSFVLLARVVTVLPVGLVYAVWSGLGTAAIVAIGATVFHEPLTPVSLLGIALIIGGVVLLNLSGAH